MSLSVGGSHGTSGKDLFVGAHLPRQMGWMKDGTNFNMMGPVWIKFDSLELKPDTEFKGSVFGERNPAKAKANPQYGNAKLSGTFSGKVCDRR